MSEVIQNDTLVNLLVQKGILTKQVLLGEFKKVLASDYKRQKEKLIIQGIKKWGTITTNPTIKFNPVNTKIEIEGLEKFAKASFKRLQDLLSNSEKVTQNWWKKIWHHHAHPSLIKEVVELTLINVYGGTIKCRHLKPTVKDVRKSWKNPLLKCISGWITFMVNHIMEPYTEIWGITNRVLTMSEKYGVARPL
jgi:hypothetical protein